jgi:hypothetical protein
MPLSVDWSTSVTLDDRDAPEGANGSVVDRLTLALRFDFEDRAGALGAQVQYNALRTLGVSGSEDLDLAGGLVNRKGKTVTLTKLKGLAVRAPADNVGNVTLRTSHTNGMTSLLSGDLVLKPGWAVTAGTGDLIRVLAAEDDTYEIALWGEGTEA